MKSWILFKSAIARHVLSMNFSFSYTIFRYALIFSQYLVNWAQYFTCSRIIPCSDRHFYCVNIRLFVYNILCVQTENINIFLTGGKQKELIASTTLFLFRWWKLAIWFIIVDIWVVKYQLKVFGKYLSVTEHTSDGAVFEFFLNIITIWFFIEQ